MPQLTDHEIRALFVRVGTAGVACEAGPVRVSFDPRSGMLTMRSAWAPQVIRIHEGWFLGAVERSFTPDAIERELCRLYRESPVELRVC